MSGNYTDIVEIVAPSSAVAGETVLVTVKVKNIHTYGFRISVAVTYDTSRFIGPVDKGVAAGATGSWSGSFTMPGNDVTIWAYSSYWGEDGLWHLDDEAAKDVEMVAPAKGVITGKWVNKAPEGFRLSIPVSVKADGNTFEVGVKYKNLGRSVIAGCEVKVWDPDATLRASPAIDWTGMSTNEELSKEYNICRVDKAGTWTVRIRFLTNDYVELDRFDGSLLYAQEELVPTFSNFAVASFSKA